MESERFGIESNEGEAEEPTREEVTKASGGEEEGRRPDGAAAAEEGFSMRAVSCVRHRDVQALRRCEICRGAMCATCDFEISGGVHLCPDCATSKENAISSRRRHFASWSIGLAVWGFVACIGLMAISEFLESDGAVALVGTGLLFAVVIPCIVGLSLGMSAFKKRLRNPRGLYFGLVANALILSGYFLLLLVGMFAE